MQIDEFLELTKKRRTIRRFKPDPVPDECIEKMLEAARFAQSGGNAQPWEFIVVKDKETKNRIVELVAEAHRYNNFILNLRKRTMPLYPYKKTDRRK